MWVIKMFRRKRRFLPFVLIILACAALVLTLSFVRPVVMSVANSHLRNTALRIIKNDVLKTFENGKLKYDDIVIISNDANEKISAISVNFPYVNKIKASLALDILKEISTDQTVISIPLGNFFRNEFMWGMGPKIPFKIMPNPTVDVNLRDDFTGLSINQTVHEIYLDVETNVFAVAPMVKTGAKVKTSFLIAHTVIVGDVPENYTGINEIPGSIEDYILDVTP